MSILIDFDLKPQHETSNFEKIDLRTADIPGLTVYVLMGRLTLELNGVNFSTYWSHSVLGVAAGLWHVLKRSLQESHAEAKYDFVDSDASICFKRKGIHLIVTTNYMDGIGQVDFAEYSDAVELYVEKVYTSLCRYFPQIKENNNIKTWYPVPGFPVPTKLWGQAQDS